MHELEELRRRSRERGVETHYHDIDGVLREASEEALRAMLAALASDGDEVVPWLPPVTVFWDGAGVLPLHAPAGTLRVTLTVTLEGGERFTEERDLASLSALDATEGDTGRRVLLSRTLPFGYHQVRVAIGEQAQTAAIFSAPQRVFQGREGRSWGVFAPTYALHSERSLGIGDLADLEQLATWVGQAGGATLATLPLTATFVSEPFDPSPYAPISRLFFSELYLALDNLPELALAGAEVREALATAQAEAAALASPSVDYARVASVKRQLTQQLCQVVDAHAALRAELDAWITAHPSALHYARFVATHEAPSASFGRWLPESAWLPPEHPSVRHHVYVQWRLADQLAGVAQRALEHGVGLYLDMPLGAHPSGYDAYRYRDALLTGCGQGAPPDTLFDGGQDWGFAPLHPRRSQASAHAYFRASVASQMQHAEVLRIDHVMGLHRSYCVPSGLGAREGVYVRQPADELYAVLTIESHRHQTYVVGEDLGTVPDEVRAAMARHGIGRLHVAQYEADAAASGTLPENAIASLNTHDMPPFAAFHAARGGDPAQAEQALLTELHTLGASGARRVLVNLEDLWLEMRPQNVPGTGPETPNWRGRLALSLAQLPHDARVAAGVAALARTSQPLVLRASGPRAAASINASRATELDLYLFNEGTHERLFDVLGAHPGQHAGAEGVYFAVWAPNASWVSVLGSFNDWWPEHQPLFRQGASGVWSAFVPGARVGDLYKYRVVTAEGAHLDKADPFAIRSEQAPQTASIVHTHGYAWRDHDWMSARAEKQRVGAPVSIYELHLGSWRRREDGSLLSYAEAAPLLVEHVTRLGFTHVELLPVMEHPFYASWGYQITGFFAASSRYGTPEELMALVDALHAAGIGVILDWVPGHFPSDDFALARFDGTCLYEHEDPRRGVHPDWKSLIFNYGRREVQAFLISSAVYWVERFHIDGLRVDGVASMLYLDYSRKAGEWIPNEHGGRENLDAIQFLRRLNEVLYGRHPDTQTTAEESTSWPMVSRPTWVGGLGFGFKWDLGWMNDVLRYFGRDPVHRRFHQEQLTFRSMYAFQENFVLPLSHDEVVHGKGSLLGKMPGDVWQKFANLRLLYAFMYAQPGHKLLFQGAELAPWDEWSHDRPLDLGLLSWSTHQGIFDLLAALNRVYRAEPALHELDFVAAGFEWVETRNPEWSVLAFERIARDGLRVLCVFNFTPVPREGYRVGVLQPGTWAEILNTDAGLFAGSGVGNAGAVASDPVAAQGRAHSLALRLPPLGALYLRSPR
jgi:alpha-1,4-glucan:alpha-1,4-glucan 6-glycosyltransferase/4-alpha-glucanotransferase